MKDLDKFQTRLAQYLEQKYAIKKLSFVVAPDTFDFWAQLRERNPRATLPPSRRLITVQLESFDPRKFNEDDQFQFQHLAGQVWLDYLGIETHQRLRFCERTYGDKEVAQTLIEIWNKTRKQRLQSFEPQWTEFGCAEIFDAMKIFLHHVEDSRDICTKKDMGRALQMTKRMLKYVNRICVDDIPAFNTLTNRLFKQLLPIAKY